MAKPAYQITKLECDAFDTRVVDRHIASGRVSSKDLNGHLGKLGDEADNAEEVIVGIGEEPTTAEDDA